MKTCSKCHKVKPYECFYRYDKCKDRHRQPCKACELEYQHRRKLRRQQIDQFLFQPRITDA